MRPNATTPRILDTFIGSLLWCVRSASPCPQTQKLYADETDFLAIQLLTAMAVDSGSTQEGCFYSGAGRRFLRSGGALHRKITFRGRQELGWLSGLVELHI